MSRAVFRKCCDTLEGDAHLKHCGDPRLALVWRMLSEREWPEPAEGDAEFADAVLTALDDLKTGKEKT